MASKGNVVKQAIGNLSSPLGPGDPQEIAWVQAQLSAFAKYLAKEWATEPDLSRIYTVALYDANRISREKARRLYATPEGRAAAIAKRQRRRSTPEGKAREVEYSQRCRAKKKANGGG